MRKNNPRGLNGFTLIEVVVSLMLIGILGVIAVFGLNKVVNGYMQAKQNSEDAQKIQIAMTRFVKEMDMTTNIVAISPTAITYTKGTVTNTIAFSGSVIQLTGIAPVTPAAILVNNVTTFTLDYFDSAGIATVNPSKVRRVDIVNLTITGSDNQAVTFSTSIVVMESYV